MTLTRPYQWWVSLPTQGGRDVQCKTRAGGVRAATRKQGWIARVRGRPPARQCERRSPGARSTVVPVTGPSGAPPSNTQVDRAGAVLREGVGGFRDPGFRPRVDEALVVVDRWRALFRQPLQDVLHGLEELVVSEAPGSEVDVSARPKRLPSIARKLRRLTNMRLSQMEDIGGCRAKLPEAARVRAVLERILERWPGAQVDDYTASPQATGYRAIHVVVVEAGRRIEIQLRTPGQNRWADEVERWSDRLGHDLKNEKGPPS